MLESRTFNLLMAFVCYQLLIAAFYFQYVEGLAPCPLCIFQRIAVFILSVWFLMQGIHNPLSSSRWHIFYNVAAILTLFVGGGISARHAYLQSLPASEVPACGPSLDYLVDILPIMEVFDVVLKGSGSCAAVSWDFLGFTMPMWLLFFFIGMFAVLAWRLFNYFKPSDSIFTSA
ncbi:MAG: disulfide bond formation protein DsbB [Polaribacter sp.]|jgi:disulfide bond formation protein DsbB